MRNSGPRLSAAPVGLIAAAVSARFEPTPLENMTVGLRRRGSENY